MSTFALELETRTVPATPELPPPAPSGISLRGRLALAGIAVWIASGVYLVAPDQQAVETVFGRVASPRVMPGIHYALPWPIEIVTKLKVRQLQRLIVGGDPADSVLGRTPPLRSQFLTGDQNIINLRVAVQYSVGVPADYLFQAANPAQLVGSAVEAELSRRVALRSVDAVLITEKVAIQEEVRVAAQRLLDTYRAGVQLSTVNIESAAPPPEAAEAFRDVASARADTARIVSNAQGYANDLIPRARGQAQQMLEESSAYRQRAVDQASGDAARFNQIAVEYAHNPDVTRRRLYLEVMEQVLPQIKKLIVEKNGTLDLTIVGRDSASGPAK